MSHIPSKAMPHPGHHAHGGEPHNDKLHDIQPQQGASHEGVPPQAAPPSGTPPAPRPGEPPAPHHDTRSAPHEEVASRAALRRATTVGIWLGLGAGLVALGAAVALARKPDEARPRKRKGRKKER
jgi:hypothetical protein